MRLVTYCYSLVIGTINSDGFVSNQNVILMGPSFFYLSCMTSQKSNRLSNTSWKVKNVPQNVNFQACFSGLVEKPMLNFGSAFIHKQASINRVVTANSQCRRKQGEIKCFRLVLSEGAREYVWKPSTALSHLLLNLSDNCYYIIQLLQCTYCVSCVNAII